MSKVLSMIMLIMATMIAKMSVHVIMLYFHDHDLERGAIALERAIDTVCASSFMEQESLKPADTCWNCGNRCFSRLSLKGVSVRHLPRTPH